MKESDSDELRINLKYWMDLARHEPINIELKSAESFVLMHAYEFEKIHIDLASLSGIAQGRSDVVHGKVTKSQPRIKEFHLLSGVLQIAHLVQHLRSSRLAVDGTESRVI